MDGPGFLYSMKSTRHWWASVHCLYGMGGWVGGWVGSVGCGPTHWSWGGHTSLRSIPLIC